MEEEKKDPKIWLQALNKKFEKREKEIDAEMSGIRSRNYLIMFSVILISLLFLMVGKNPAFKNFNKTIDVRLDENDSLIQEAKKIPQVQMVGYDAAYESFEAETVFVAPNSVEGIKTGVVCVKNYLGVPLVLELGASATVLVPCDSLKDYSAGEYILANGELVHRVGGQETVLQKR